jgi:hypothetical protein
MAVDGLGLESKNTDQDTGEAAYTDEVADNSNLDDVKS